MSSDIDMISLRAFRAWGGSNREQKFYEHHAIAMRTKSGLTVKKALAGQHGPLLHESVDLCQASHW